MFSVYTGRDTVLRVHAVNDVVSELLGNSIQLLNLFTFLYKKEDPPHRHRQTPPPPQKKVGFKS